MTTRIKRINPDGSIELTVTDTRTLEEKLQGKLTFQEKLDLAFPTNPVDVTADWVEFDDHKRLK